MPWREIGEVQECALPKLLPEALGKPGNCRLMAGRFFSTKTCPGSTNFQEGDGTVFVVNVFRMVGDVEPNFSRQTKRTTAGGPGPSNQRQESLSASSPFLVHHFQERNDLTP
jgi:hypothetical protein